MRGRLCPARIMMHDASTTHDDAACSTQAGVARPPHLHPRRRCGRQLCLCLRVLLSLQLLPPAQASGQGRRRSVSRHRVTHDYANIYLSACPPTRLNTISISTSSRLAWLSAMPVAPEP